MNKEQIKQMQEENEKLKEDIKIKDVALNRANMSKKELPSLFFLNKKGDIQRLGGLSETKRMLETQHPEILKAMLGEEKVTNYEFNDILVPVLKKGLDLE